MKQAYIEAVVYNRNKNVTEEILKTLLKSFIWFHSANKIDNYNRGVRAGRKREKSRKIYRAGQKRRTIHVYLEPLLPESFPSPGITIHLSSLGYHSSLCWSVDLLCGQLTIESGSTPVCSYLQYPHVSELVPFLLLLLFVFFFIGAVNDLLYIP